MFVLKQLRRKKKVNQTDFAQIIGVSLRTVQLYEQKDANIPIKNLTKIAQYFDLTIAELYSYEVNEEEGIYDTERQIMKKGYAFKQIGPKRYVISVALVSAECHQQYVEGHGNAAFLEELAQTSFVVENEEKGNYLSFEIVGNSMDDGSIEGVPDKAIVLGKRFNIENLNRVFTDKSGIWIIVHKGGVLCKEIVAYDEKTRVITCHSYNTSPEYADFEISSAEVVQLFRVIKKEIN